MAHNINLFIHTSPFRPEPQYSRNALVPLRRPTADSALLVSAALLGLRAIYRPGFKYAKAGVMLMDLETEPALRGGLMATMDKLNDRYGRGTLVLGSAGLKSKERTWTMQQNLLTPQYATSWEDLPVAKA